MEIHWVQFNLSKVTISFVSSTYLPLQGHYLVGEENKTHICYGYNVKEVIIHNSEIIRNIGQKNPKKQSMKISNLFLQNYIMYL